MAIYNSILDTIQKRIDYANYDLRPPTREEMARRIDSVNELRLGTQSSYCWAEEETLP